MQLLLLILRLMLSLMGPAFRDGLALGARADGRIEHRPFFQRLSDGWQNCLGHGVWRCVAGRQDRSAGLKVRADGALWRTRESGAD